MEEDEVVEYETVETENDYQDYSTVSQEYPHYEYEQGQGNVWDQEMTFSLIDEYRNHLQDFLYPKGLMIRDIWKTISRNMQARGYNLTPAACDNKWRQLKKTFRYNAPYGGRKALSKWIYYEALEDILGNRKIAQRIIWKQRSTIKKEIEDPDSPQSYSQEEMQEYEYKHPPFAKLEEPPKWFEDFLTRYQEEEKQKRKTLQKMHNDLVALEKQKCVLLENLIKNISKINSAPKIVEAISVSQEVFEDEL